MFFWGILDYGTTGSDKKSGSVTLEIVTSKTNALRVSNVKMERGKSKNKTVHKTATERKADN